MYETSSGIDIIGRPVILAIPIETKIFKMDVVKGLGAGIWFNDSDLPSIICETSTDEDAEKLIKGFQRTQRKYKMKVITGNRSKENE